MYRLQQDKTLTSEMLVKYIQHNGSSEARKAKLKDYYNCKHAILGRTMRDAAKPNNKIVNSYANYITDMYVGYFLGIPVSYNSEEQEHLEALTAIFNYNDESAENSELAKDASVCGVAYELLYIDSDGQVRFKKIDNVKAIPIFDDTLESNLLYFIRYYDDEDIVTGNVTTTVEVYSKTTRSLYKLGNGSVEFIGEEPHNFKEVPIVIYQNNEEEMGDFEPVITLIDAYDKLQSDSVNDLEYFSDAYLALYGMSGTEASDIAAMKEQRVLLMETDAKAEWLVKEINDSYVENLKNRIDDNIHKFSKCPSMTDKEFSSNASGVAMRFKLMGMDNAANKKERAFKKALQRRIELIAEIQQMMGSTYDWRSINITFKRNIPQNLVETAEVLTKVGYLLSEETQVGLLPLDIDYEAEKTKKDAEAISGYAFGYEVNSNEPLAETNT